MLINEPLCAPPPPSARPPDPLDGDLGAAPGWSDVAGFEATPFADLLARPVIIGAAPPREGPHDRATD